MVREMPRENRPDFEIGKKEAKFLPFTVNLLPT